jgi:pimeloyl-ACP methyl ester carboxylesterase
MTSLRAIHRPGLRWIVTPLLLLGLTGLALSRIGAADAANAADAGAAATARAAASHQGSKPTVVLVHGAWADSGSWDQVVARLQRQGYRVVAFPTPLRGLPDDSAYLAAFLQSVGGRIVLVGHSYGGAVITNAATGNLDVKALVYVDAFLPAQGETIAQLVGAQPGSCVAGDPTQIFDLVPYPGAPRGSGRLCQAERVPVLLRQRPAGPEGGRPGRDPAAGLDGHPRPAVGATGLGRHPVVGAGRDRRPGHPAGHPAGHGRTGPRPDRHGEGLAPADGLPPRGGDPPHSRRGPQRELTRRRCAPPARRTRRPWTQGAA